MELPLLFFRIMITVALLGFISMFIKMCDVVILKPERLRSKLRKQGIRGPRPSFLLGNVGALKKTQSLDSKAQQGEQPTTHNCSSIIFPFLDQWTKQYGDNIRGFRFQPSHIHDVSDWFFLKALFLFSS